MIKAKIIGLVLSTTIIGGGIGAALISKIDSNTKVATAAITVEGQQVDSATNLMGQATTKLGDLGNRVSNLQNELKAANVTVGNLQSQNKELKGQIITLTNEIDTLKVSLENSHGNAKDLTEKLTTANTKIDGLKKTVESNDALIAKQKHDIEQKNLALQDYIGLYLQEVKNNKALSSKLTAAKESNKANETTIAALNNKVTKLEKSLADSQAQNDKDNTTAKEEMGKVEVAVNGQTSAINNATTAAKSNDQGFDAASNNLKNALTK